MYRSALALAVLALAAAGCASAPSRYAWGSYEDLLYVTQAKPGSVTPEAQAEQLERDRQAALAGNQPLPPGWHAHLGYVYFQGGRAELARRELLAEKTAYPESATLVDRLLKNMTGSAERAP